MGGMYALSAVTSMIRLRVIPRRESKRVSPLKSFRKTGLPRLRSVQG
jgi:hypothetical protein